MGTRRLGIIAAVSLSLIAPTLVSGSSQADEPPPPMVGDCLQVDDAFAPTSPYAVVDCAETHNSEVYDIAPYPTDMGAPSTLSEDELNRVGEECSFEAFDEWIGQEIRVPIRVWDFFVSLPSDDQWTAGDRDVLCRTVRPTPQYDALNYRGSIPELIASTPILEWLSCMTKAPKSGKDNATTACVAKSTWLLLGGAVVKGKVTGKYPKDLQSAADKACTKLTKRYGKKGTTGLAALLSKRNVSTGSVYTECFIPVKSWNGKVK